MRIVFVRHGHPNYKDDCLTELGHLHAKAAAERLKNEGIQKIYSSTCGRAFQTAEYTAKALSLDVQGLDFMREIKWGGEKCADLPDKGHPWETVRTMADEGLDLLNTDWDKNYPFEVNPVVGCCHKMADDIDAWLKTLGYTREGLYYRVGERPFDTVALFSHGGSSSAALAHIFNLPFPFVCSAIRPDFTAITVVKFSDEQGKLVAPEFEIMNDARHIKNISTENIFGR